MTGGERFFPWRRLTDAQPPALPRQCRLNQSIIAERLILSYLSEMRLSIPRLNARSAACSFSENPDAGGQVSKTNPQIAVVDDDESMREAMRGLMKSLGYTAQTFASAGEFLNSCQVPRTSCLIADVQMRGMTGLELHRHLMASGKTIPTILMTAYPDDTVRERALQDGVVCYLSKPFDENDLLACIRSSLNI